jgi:hypothetical protein
MHLAPDYSFWQTEAPFYPCWADRTVEVSDIDLHKHMVGGEVWKLSPKILANT